MGGTQDSARTLQVNGIVCRDMDAKVRRTIGGNVHFHLLEDKVQGKEGKGLGR